MPRVKFEWVPLYDSSRFSDETRNYVRQWYYYANFKSTKFKVGEAYRVGLTGKFGSEITKESHVETLSIWDRLSEAKKEVESHFKSY